MYNLGHKFEVVTNIRGASVTDKVGLVALDLDGNPEEVERALSYLRDKNVKVEPMEGDDMPPALDRGAAPGPSGG